MNHELIDLRSLIDKNLVFYLPNLCEKNLSIERNIPENIKIFGDREKLMIVFKDLVKDAIEFSDHDGTIKIAAKNNGGEVQISLSDNGNSVSDEKVKNQNGEICVEINPKGGFRFTLSIPKRKEDENSIFFPELYKDTFYENELESLKKKIMIVD